MDKALEKIFIHASSSSQRLKHSVLNIPENKKSLYCDNHSLKSASSRSKMLQAIPKLITVSTLFALSSLAWSGNSHDSEQGGGGCQIGCNSGGGMHGHGNGHGSHGNGHGGVKGPIGPQGPQGETGAAGEKGDTGADGVDGLSAYEVALGNGFDGTESEWLLSLKGMDGQSFSGEEYLNESKNYTDSRINDLNRRFDNFKGSVYAAVASSIAIASLPQPTDAGYSMLSIGAGTWKSEQGFAIGFSGVTQNNKYVYKMAASGNTEGDFGAGASVGVQWK